MRTMLTYATAVAASLALAGGAAAQASGGPAAKGNAPLKPAHTVNDGAAKRGANSFTERQAMEHIQKSGFTSVTGLVKGSDGVWRGQAMRGGAAVGVAMDFKGNVSTTGGEASMNASTAGAASAPMAGPETRTSTTVRSSSTSTSASSHAALRRHGERHAAVRGHGSCANPSPNGAACSGVDRDHNGVSDREDRTIAGSHP